jgi:uncharacterized protein with beta-barrel porin domain
VRDSVLVSASTELRVTRNATVGVKFDSQLFGSSQTYAGSGTLRYAW